MAVSLALSAAIFTVTLALIFTHPRGMNEAVAAGVGMTVMLAFCIVSPDDIAQIIGKTATMLLFLLGMMLVTATVEAASLFNALAVVAARSTRWSGRTA